LDFFIPPPLDSAHKEERRGGRRGDSHHPVAISNFSTFILSRSPAAKGKGGAPAADISGRVLGNGPERGGRRGGREDSARCFAPHPISFSLFLESAAPVQGRGKGGRRSRLLRPHSTSLFLHRFHRRRRKEGGRK